MRAADGCTFSGSPCGPGFNVHLESHPCLPRQPRFHLPFHALMLSAVPFSPDASNKTDAGGKEYAGDEKSSLQTPLTSIPRPWRSSPPTSSDLGSSDSTSLSDRSRLSPHSSFPGPELRQPWCLGHCAHPPCPSSRHPCALTLSRECSWAWWPEAASCVLLGADKSWSWGHPPSMLPSMRGQPSHWLGEQKPPPEPGRLPVFS